MSHAVGAESFDTAEIQQTEGETSATKLKKPYDPGTLPSSASQCIPGNVYLRTNQGKPKKLFEIGIKWELAYSGVTQHGLACYKIASKTPDSLLGCAWLSAGAAGAVSI